MPVLTLQWLQVCYLQYQLTLHQEREGELIPDIRQLLHQRVLALSDRQR